MNNGQYEASLADLQTALKLDSHADVYDLLMQLLEANPDPVFFDKVTESYQVRLQPNDFLRYIKLLRMDAFQKQFILFFYLGSYVPYTR